MSEEHPAGHGEPPGHRHDGMHEHDHPDTHDHPTGLRGVLYEIFRPHSHDAADSLDTALKSSEQGIRAVKISFLILLATSIIQLGIVAVTGSVSLLADTIHSFSDALTSIPLFLAFKLSQRPSNRRYTYGYGRAEDLAGIFIIVMIAGSALVAGWQAIERLIDPQPITHLWVLFTAGIVGFLGNEVVALYRIREGKTIGSAALVADGYHARTDGFTSLAVAFGAIGVALGFPRADPIVGLLISVAIFVVLASATKQVYARLMDAVDPKIVGEIEHQSEHVDGVITVSNVRVRWVGHRLSTDLTIEVDGTQNVARGHEIATAVRTRLTSTVAHLDEATVHVHESAHAEHAHS